MKKSIGLLVVIFCFNCIALSQNSIITVSYGSGKTKDIAINNALRAAIEQTIGGFISTNTLIINDEIISDEMLAISQGNIENYEILSEHLNKQKKEFVVTISASITPQKIIKLIKAKGYAAEYKGNIAFHNLLAEQYYEESEPKVIIDYLKTWEEIVFFDYEISDIGQPFKINETTAIKRIKYGYQNITYDSYNYPYNNSLEIGGFSFRPFATGTFKESSRLNKFNYYSKGELIKSDWSDLYNVYLVPYKGETSRLKYNSLFHTNTWQEALSYQFGIELFIDCTPNENFFQFYDGLLNILKKLQLNEKTYQYRNESGLALHTILDRNKKSIYLRNNQTIDILLNFSKDLYGEIFGYVLRSGNNDKIDYLQQFSRAAIWSPFDNAISYDYSNPLNHESSMWYQEVMSSARTLNNPVLDWGDIYFLLKIIPESFATTQYVDNSKPNFILSNIQPGNKVVHSAVDDSNNRNYFKKFNEYKLQKGKYYFSQHRVIHLISNMQEISSLKGYIITPVK